MTKKRGKSSKKLKLPLYKNPWEFVESLPNLDEGLKINKNEIIELECRLKYTLKCQQDSDLNNTDYLYKLFGDQVDRSPKFMRRCEQQYATENMDWIEQLSSTYLESTGKSMKNWMQGIKKGVAGNMLDLYVLSKVTGVHCYVHLKGKNYWSTLKDIPKTHDEFMQRCNMHLAYLGNNTFIELVLRTASVSYKIFGIDQPLALTESAPVVIGTLSSAESSTLDMLLKLEGSALDNIQKNNIPLPTEMDQTQMPSTSNKKDENTDTKLDQEESDSTECYGYIDQSKENTLNIHDDPLNVYPRPQYKPQEEKTLSKNVTPAPKSTTQRRKLALRKRTQKMEITNNKKDKNLCKKVENNDSDSTIIYEHIDQPNVNTPNIYEEPMDVYPRTRAWTQKKKVSSKTTTPPLTNTTESRKSTLRKRTYTLQRPLNEAPTIKMQKFVIKKQNKSKTKKSTKKTTNANPSKKKGNPNAISKEHKFAITSHGLLRKKRKIYKFTCPITKCKKIFHTVKEWNCHHLSLHSSVKYQCGKCLKWVTTPNRFADHQYYHQEARHKCGRCNKTFHFNSGLQLHKNKHRRNKVYKCFAKNCAHIYKWPQDLLRHVKTHRIMRWHCEYCDYTSNETRLLRQHKRTHLNIKKFACRRNCNDMFKHAMQRYRHEKKCQ